MPYHGAMDVTTTYAPPFTTYTHHLFHHTTRLVRSAGRGYPDGYRTPDLVLHRNLNQVLPGRANAVNTPRFTQRLPAPAGLLIILGSGSGRRLSVTYLLLPQLAPYLPHCAVGPTAF